MGADTKLQRLPGCILVSSVTLHFEKNFFPPIRAHRHGRRLGLVHAG